MTAHKCPLNLNWAEWSSWGRWRPEQHLWCHQRVLNKFLSIWENARSFVSCWLDAPARSLISRAAVIDIHGEPDTAGTSSSWWQNKTKPNAVVPASEGEVTSLEKRHRNLQNLPQPSQELQEHRQDLLLASSGAFSLQILMYCCKMSANQRAASHCYSQSSICLIISVFHHHFTNFTQEVTWSHTKTNNKAAGNARDFHNKSLPILSTSQVKEQGPAVTPDWRMQLKEK